MKAHIFCVQFSLSNKVNKSELVAGSEPQMISIGDTEKSELENVNSTNFMCSKMSNKD
jgi:hypothetical protein